MNGVVIVCEKNLASPLMDASSLSKMQVFAPHAGAIYAGIGPDFRLLCQKSRQIVTQYGLSYNEPMAIHSMSRDIASLIQEKTQSRGYRPFGVSMLVAGYDEKGPQLFEINPSGTFIAWKATAIGKGTKTSKTILERRFNPAMEIEDGIHTALLTLKESFEGEMSHENIEVAVVRKDAVFRILTPSQIKDYIDELE